MRVFLLLAPLVCAAAASAQDQPPAAPPMSPDQQLSMLVSQSDQARIMGDVKKALQGYNQALERVRSEPALKYREEEVLQHLSQGYVAAKQPKEAVRVSTAILAMHKEDCKPGSPRVENCADAQYGLGMAM